MKGTVSCFTPCQREFADGLEADLKEGGRIPPRSTDVDHVTITMRPN
jgi:hypothetical protein